MAKYFLYLMGFFLAVNCQAEESNVQSIPLFAGGLSASQVMHCEQQYKKACPITHDQAMPPMIQQANCIEQKMAQDKSCAQASEIIKLTGASPTKIKQYGLVTIFETISFADGISNFYLVDAKGKLISLNNNLKYPNAVLTKFTDGTYHHQLLSNQHQQFIFQQELRDKDCVACARVGIAKIAYEFDQKGNYLGNQVFEIRFKK